MVDVLGGLVEHARSGLPVDVGTAGERVAQMLVARDMGEDAIFAELGEAPAEVVAG